MILRASSAPSWMKCGVFQSSETESDPAREGTCAAWVAELVLNGDASSADDLLGETHENGWTVDENMVSHMNDYVAMLRNRKGMQGSAEVALQHPTLPLAGTSDHIGWTFQDRTVLYITDLKYGYKIVEPTSWQLVAYTYMTLSMTPRDRWPDLIHMSIFQPRAIHAKGPYRKRICTIDELMPEFEQMANRIQLIISDQQQCEPAGQCEHCVKAVSCEALTRSVYDMWEPVQRRSFHEPTPQQLGSELAMLERMREVFDSRYATVRAEAEARIGNGGYVDGWRIQRKFGKRKFTKPDAYIQMLTGVDPTDKKTCTPAELIRRGASEAVVATITEKPFIGFELKRFDADDVLAELNSAKKRGTP